MKSMLITNHFFPYLFSLFFFWVISKETVGNSWTVLKVILGHKYHHNHSVRSISTDYSQNPQQKMRFIVYCCLRLLYRKHRHDAQITWPSTSLWGVDAKWLNRAPKTKLILCPRDPQEYSRISLSLPGRILKEYRYSMGFAKSHSMKCSLHKWAWCGAARKSARLNCINWIHFRLTVGRLRGGSCIVIPGVICELLQFAATQ